MEQYIIWLSYQVLKIQEVVSEDEEIDIVSNP